MDYPEFKDLTPEGLRKYIETHKEDAYLLVDVRQPSEYEQSHIPGARLIPLLDLGSEFFNLPSDKDMIFYCHSGGRSVAAASLAAEGEVTSGKIYNLEGGMLAWDGKTLADFPRVQVFDKDKTTPELLLTAMDLEKGAFRFYTHLLEKFPSEPFTDTILKLSKAETAHAKTVYGFWKKDQENPRPFEELFDSLEGEILEGGKNLQDMIHQAETMEGNLCLNLLELSLNIEYSAFDLYRTIADQAADAEARDAFLTIAQSEKAHMRTLVQAIPKCPEQ